MPLDFVSIVLFFPLLLPVWQTRPITSTDMFPAPYVTVVPDEVMAKQHEALELVDAELRARVLMYLHLTRHPKAAATLHEQLARERSIEVIATVLEQLCLYKTDAGMAAEVAPFLKHHDTAVRVAAVRLYGRLPVVKLTPVEELAAGDPQDRVRRTAWQVLCENPTRCSPTFLREHWTDTDARSRADALVASLSLPEATAARQTFLTACGDNEVIVRCALAVHLPEAPAALAGELCRKLARDPFASVRESVAQVVPKLGYGDLLPLLLELADDRDPEVRRLALVSLAGSGVPPAVDRAVAHLGDPTIQVHRQAEETLVALHQQTSVVPAVAARIEDPDPVVRFHVFRILGRLNAKEYVPALVEHMNREQRPVNIAAAIFGLAELHASEVAPEVLKFCAHSDVGVRVEVAHALGTMAVPTTYSKLEELVFDKAPQVRESALLAVGRLADGHFSPMLLKVLQSVGAKSGISGWDRNIACWAAGRTRPISMDLMKRLVVQGTTPVIPTDFGPIFEDETVLVSVDFALAQCALDLPAVKPLAQQAMDFHSKAPGVGVSMGPGMLVPSPELIEYARQARAFMEKREVKPALRPTQDILLPYRPMKKPTE